jgi:hypothetical protein
MLINFFRFYATFIAGLFISILAIFQLMWIVNIFIPYLVLPISIVISLIITYLLVKNDTSYLGTKYFKTAYLENLFITMIIFIIAGIIAYYSFDKAGDGRWYHQAMIILLKSGWNPIYDYSKNDFLKYGGNNIDLISHTYAKANEILAFSFVAFFKHIQIGKIINILFAGYGFAMSYLVLNTVFRFKFKFNLLICCYIVFNPIFFSQYLSFYLDANLLVCYTVLLFSILLYLYQMTVIKKVDIFTTLQLMISALLLINLKSTGLVYAFLLLLAFAFVKLIFELKILKLNSWIICKKNIIFGVVFLSIFLLFSIHPYIENLYLGRHIFWPLLGRNTPIVLSSWEATGWSPYNKFITFLLTYFLPYPSRYPPFSFVFSLKGFVAGDYAFCALGPFWGIIFLVSIVCCVKYCYQNIKKIFTDFTSFAIIFSIILIVISVITVPYFWYIRYAPQILLLPAIALVILLKYENTWFSGKVVKIFIMMCVVNSGLFFSGSTILTVYRTYKFVSMEHICLHEPCVLEIQDHNAFEVSLPNQLREDGVKVVYGSCLNRPVIWQDSLSYGSNNIICK